MRRGIGINMPLVLNTNIDALVNKKIKGKIARIGGTVNQLLQYEGCTVEDINLLDGGYGIIAEIQNAGNLYQMYRSIKKIMKQEVRFFKKGHRMPRDRKTLILDLHKAYLQSGLSAKYDCSISSNLIEHSPNPILLLLNFYYITKEGGYQYHAIPHYKYTFDMYRNPTTIEHLIADFESMTTDADSSHREDYRQSAVVKHGWQRDFHKKYPMSYPYMHYHVFDEVNVRQLADFMFEDVCNDILTDDEFSDNVVIFRNTLNDNFCRRFAKLIDFYLGKQRVSHDAPNA